MFESKGKKNFTNCQHKAIGYETQMRGSLVYEAVLECPNPQGDGLASDFKTKTYKWHTSEEKARNTLRRIAAKEACGPCAMACMSRLDLLKLQLEEAATEKALIETRTELAELQARKITEKAEAIAGAVEEVNGINIKNLDTDAIEVQVDPHALGDNLA